MTDPKDIFNRHLTDCYSLTEFIRCELDRMATDADDNPNWAQTETLQHHRHQLKQVLIGMMGWESEAECGDIIEETLEDCR